MRKVSLAFGVLAVVCALGTMLRTKPHGPMNGWVELLLEYVVAAAQVVPALGFVWARTTLERRVLWGVWCLLSVLILMAGGLTTSGFLS